MKGQWMETKLHFDFVHFMKIQLLFILFIEEKLANVSHHSNAMFMSGRSTLAW